MSVTKGAFTGQLDDIDDLFPPLPKKRDPATSPNSVSTDPNPEANPQSNNKASSEGEGSGSPDESHEDEVVDAEVVNSLSDRESQGSAPSDQDNPVAPVGMPTTAVSAWNLKKLRALTTAEKARNHLTARTYGQVVLDAIEQNADKLQSFWKGSAEEAATGGGLFKRQPIVSKRRRHAEPTGQITLQGITFEDAHVIDRLWQGWGAPSRSAFIDQALTFYFEDLEALGA